MNTTFSIKSITIKLIISCCFLWILFSFAQTEELLQVFTQINWFYFFLSFALVPILLLLSCLKWKLILDLNSNKIPFSKLLKIYLIGYMFSNILPSTFGGDVARSYYSGKIINNLAFSATSVFIERFSGIIVLLLLVVFTPLLHKGLYTNPYIYIPVICALIIMILLVLIWSVRSSMQIIHRFSEKMIYYLDKAARFSRLHTFILCIKVLERIHIAVFSRLKKLRHEITAAFSLIKKDIPLMVKIFLLTISFYVLTLFNVYVGFMAFNITPDFIATCALIPIILFVGQVPVTFLGNIGFFESIFVFYFLLLNIPASETLAMGLLLRLKMIATGSAGCFFYITNKTQKDNKHVSMN